MSLNTTPLIDSDTPLLLPTEKIMATYQDVHFTYESGNGYPGSGANYDVPKGILYLSTHRIIFIGVPAQLAFRSLEISLSQFKTRPSLVPKLVQPWLGSPHLALEVHPVHIAVFYTWHSHSVGIEGVK